MQKIRKQMLNGIRTKVTVNIPTCFIKPFKKKLIEENLTMTEFIVSNVLKYIEKD